MYVHTYEMVNGKMCNRTVYIPVNSDTFLVYNIVKGIRRIY